MIRTPICDLLGIKTPIFGFSHSVDVVVEIARAGGFPVLGLAREMPEELPDIIAETQERLGDLPFGIDLMLPPNIPDVASIDALKAQLPTEHVEFVEGVRQTLGIEPPENPGFFTTYVRSEAMFDNQIEAVLNSKARMVATAIGLRQGLIDEAKARGKITCSLVGSPRHAEKALAMGVEVLVAQGYDAGGHTGPIGTMSLVPQIVEMAGDTVPVLAAGGIATGQQILGSIAMGAQGGWLGTLWLASKENHTPSALMDRLIAGKSTDTVLTRAHSGKSCRVVRSDYIDAWSAEGAPEPLGMPHQQVLTGDIYTSIHQRNSEGVIYEAAGQSIFGIDEETTVSQQMAQLQAEMNTAHSRMDRWCPTN